MPRLLTKGLPIAALKLLLLVPLIWAEGAWAVDCADTNYDLTTQAEVDALGATSCDRVTGYLSVRNSSDITNLNSLANITSVGGYLRIYSNAALTNLDGLSSLTSVEGYLAIWYNAALTNLDGLASLTSVGGYLNIRNNDALANLDGLASLTSVGEDLDISGNGALTNIDDLANITSVGGYLLIDDNAALTNLDGLANITSVGGYVWIRNNAALTNLDGLASLTSVGGELDIYQNYALEDCKAVALLLGWPNGPPDDNVDGTIRVENGIGCGSVEQILASVSGPTQPVINQAATSSTSISLGFTPSTATTTAFPITSYEATCTSATADLSESPASALLDNVPVSRTLTASSGFISKVEVDINITHDRPEHLYVTLTTPQGTELILWERAGAGTEDIEGTFPTTLTPIDTLNGIAGQSMEGDWLLYVEDVVAGALVKEGVLNSWGLRITEELAKSGSGSPIEVSGATRGRDYTCTVAPVSKLGTTPVSDPYTVSVPLEVPTVPTITSTDYEDGSIILTVSVSDNGGTDITGYEATCSDGANTFTGTSTSSPITVSGLTNEVAYTCTVTATNSVGTSSASAASDPITPEEASTGLPIWLLYQATQ